MDLNKLKVVELRAELTARGLDTKGMCKQKKLGWLEVHDFINYLIYFRCESRFNRSIERGARPGS